MTTTLRPLIHALLALVLLAQGISASAAGLVIARAGTQQQLQSQPAEAAMRSAMPCHHGAAKVAAAPAPSKRPPCCNAACPDMLSCALATLALASAPALPLHWAQGLPAAAEPLAASPTAPPGASFRPPIRILAS